MDTIEYRDHHHRRATGCPAGDGGCEDMRENTRLTKETHEKVVRIEMALLGDMEKVEPGLVPWRHEVDKKIGVVYRMVTVIGFGFVTVAGTLLWQLWTHQATLTIGH